MIVQYKYLFPRPEQDAGACARRERNRLGLSCAEKLVQTCACSQTSACSRAPTCTSPDTSSGTSIHMVFEEPETEPCLPSRSSPNRAARPALGNKRPPPSRTVAQALMLPHPLPVVHGTVEEAEARLPTRAAVTPSQAAIAPTAPKPSIDTAQFRARVAVTPAHRGAQSCARGRAARAFLLSLLIGWLHIETAHV
jgi:hypothetical protein